MLSNFPLVILLSILKYRPHEIIKYVNYKKIIINWEQCYQFIHKIKIIPSPFTHPKSNDNAWLNAILNQNQPTQNVMDFPNCEIKFDNKGFMMIRGDNTNKNLGLNEAKNYENFEYLTNKNNKKIKNVKNYFIGPKSSFILLKNGTIMTCGNNSYGNLGIGYERHAKFTLVYNKNEKYEEINPIKNVKSVHVCGSFTILLLNNGKIMTAGSSPKKMLTLGRPSYSSIFRIVDDEKCKDIIKILFEGDYAVMLLKTGRVLFCNKNNNYGFINKHQNHKIFEYAYDESKKIIGDVANIYLKNNDIFLLLTSNNVMGININQIESFNIPIFFSVCNYGIKEIYFQSKYPLFLHLNGSMEFMGIKFCYENKKIIYDISNIIISNNEIKLRLKNGTLLELGNYGNWKKIK